MTRTLSDECEMVSLNEKLDEIYLDQPFGFKVKEKELRVGKLKHSVIGLKQSYMKWYLRFR